MKRINLENERQAYFLEEIETMLEVTDIKQYRYCPRVVYYHYHLPRVRPVTYKMEEGILEHQAESQREMRRKFELFGIPEGEKMLDVHLSDADLGLYGRLDLLIAIPDKAKPQELIPVEYKWSTRRPGAHFKLQLAAYAWLVQKSLGIAVKQGLIYQPLLRRTTDVTISSQLLRQIPITVGKIRLIRNSEQLPIPPKRAAPCLNCEFRRICNDTI